MTERGRLGLPPDGGIPINPIDEQLRWLNEELQGQSLIGFPVVGLVSHEQERFATHGRSTCAIAAAQNTDLLLRGSGGPYQTKSTDEMIRLLATDPYRDQPRGMHIRQLKRLLRTMGLYIDGYVDPDIPSIVEVFKQNGVVIELGLQEKHWRVVANAHTEEGNAASNGFSVLDSAPIDLAPYDIPATEFAERLVHFGQENKYLGVKSSPFFSKR